MIERIISNIVKAILQQIGKDRNGEIMNVDANLLKNIIDALVTLSGNKVCTDGVNPILELETSLN